MSMTNDITHLPASPAFPAIDEARHDLERSLTSIFGVAHVLMSIATADSLEAHEISSLGMQLIKHQEAADDAFQRIFKIGDYREQAAPAELPDPTPLADDAAFLAAERELFEVKRQWKMVNEDDHPAEYERLGDRIHDLEDLIGNSPPHSLVSVAVKLRRLAAPEGIDAGPADSDIAAVHQIHAFVEKLVAGGTK
jgi:hypothetical protein